MAARLKQSGKRQKQISTSNLKKKAITVFNAFIRKRDQDLPCISCGKFTTLQAGHYYSAGKFERLRFEPDNVHGQCLKCNYFGHGELLKYRVNLQKKIGIARLNKLDLIAANRKPFKSDRFFYETIIKQYA